MTLPQRILIALSAAPGSTVAEITEAVMPMPDGVRITSAFRDPADRRARLAAREAWLADLPARVEVVSSALDGLVRRGLVERRGPPKLADWFHARMRRLGTLDALRSVYREPDEGDVEYDPYPTGPEVDRVLTAWAAMLEDYGKSPGVWRAGKSGAEQGTYAALVERGVFEAPSQRRLTEAGERAAGELRRGAA